MFVFISYKSEDSNLVRQVAELLIACGLDVWINEYRILIGDYEKFRDGINDGIGRATHAVVFTNNRWTDSGWCQVEMEGLLTHIPDRSRIVEVAIPSENKPHERYPDLLGRPAVIYRGDPRRPSHADVHDVVVAILERLGFRTDLAALPDVKKDPAWLPSYGVTFDPGPFDFWYLRTRKQIAARFMQSDIELGLRTVVYRLAAANVEISMDVYATNYESPISRLSFAENGASDDRDVYTAYRFYANRWFGTEQGHFRHIAHKPKGLHLVFVNGTSQIAVTYVVEMEGKTEPLARWERRYAVRIPNPLADAEGELAFVFSVGLPGDEAQQTRAFCRLAPWFDAVVTSADVRWPSRLQSFAMALPGFLAKAVTAAGVGYIAWGLFAQHVAAWRLVGAAVIAGITAGDLGSYLFNGTYRALIASLRPAFNDLRPIASVRRFLSDFWYHLIILPYVLFGLLGRGLVVAASYAVGVLALPLIIGRWAMFSTKPVITPPAWLKANWLMVVIAGAVLFGIAASQFTAKLVKARYLKGPKKQDDDAEG